MEEEGALTLHELPEEVKQLFEGIAVPPYLLAHLVVVHDVALRLLAAVHDQWPRLSVDDDAVRFGAATHDVGKVLHLEEMRAPGEAHRAAGEELLQQHGVPPSLARFARTHAEWAAEEELLLEDLLVALADEIWKGGRNDELESSFLQCVGERTGEEQWAAYMALDEILTVLAEDADRRLLWQSQFLPEEAQEQITDEWSEHGGIQA